MTYTPEQIFAAALGIANEMSPVLAGKPTAAILTAFAMHLGYIAGSAEHHDLDGLMAVVRSAAERYMQSVAENGGVP